MHLGNLVLRDFFVAMVMGDTQCLPYLQCSLRNIDTYTDTLIDHLYLIVRASYNFYMMNKVLSLTFSSHF